MLRYWDGSHWTEQVSDPAVDPVRSDLVTGASESARTSQSGATKDRSNDWRWSPTSAALAIIAVLVFCGVAAAGLVLHNRHHTPTQTRASFPTFFSKSPQACATEKSNIRTALEAYKAEYGSYPVTIEALTGGAHPLLAPPWYSYDYDIDYYGNINPGSGGRCT
jgi:hypothetical protein